METTNVSAEEAVEQNSSNDPSYVRSQKLVQFIVVLICRLEDELKLLRFPQLKIVGAPGYKQLVQDLSVRPFATYERRPPVWQVEGHLYVLRQELAFLDDLFSKNQMNAVERSLLVGYTEKRLLNGDLSGSLVFKTKRIFCESATADIYKISVSNETSCWFEEVRYNEPEILSIANQGQVNVTPNATFVVTVQEMTKHFLGIKPGKILYRFTQPKELFMQLLELEFNSSNPEFQFAMSSMWRPPEWKSL